MTNPTRMTPEDSAFWKMESEISRMHSVTLTTFAGPAPSLDELRDHVARRVPLVPRFRQRVAEIPFDIGRPMWVDDEHFDIENHVVAASTSVGLAGLSELVSLIVSQQLDRSRPLWELTMVTGLPEDRWAIASKVHHSMIDGLFGTEPLAILIDDAVANAPASVHWNPAPPPQANELIGRTLAELALNPSEQYRLMRSQSQRSRRRWARMLGRPPEPGTDPTGLRGPVGDTRTWSSLSVPMSAIRAARHRYGVSTHELVLALATTGIRDLLLSRDESAQNWPVVKAIVPMAVADSAAAFQGGIAAEVLELPAAEPDFEGRVRRIHRQTIASSADPVAVDTQIGVAGFSAPTLASLGLREATRRGAGAKKAHTVIVNVPGPRQELTVMGRTMTGIHPVMPLAAGVRLSIGAFSYLDQLTFGVTADRASVPDVQVVTTGIRRAFQELTQDETEPSNA